MYGPSDMYGDLDLEDVDEFEGLQPEDGREIAPDGRFQRDEYRTFDEDFENDLDDYEEEELEEYWEYDPESEEEELHDGDGFLPDDESLI